MKIVINRCYGGFSLSAKAVARMAELQGRTAYFFTGWDKYEPSSLDSLAAEPHQSFTAFDVPDPSEQRGDGNEWYRAHAIETRPDDRADALLVQVVEELGQEANGAYAKLTIVEIPDETSYQLDDYDGIESVHETHRSWA